MASSLMRLEMRRPDFSPVSPVDQYAAALEIAEYADQNGWDALVVSEHHAIDDGFLPSPVAMLGALVGRTRRLRLSASALLLPLYDPVKLAEDLAVLDLASGGRCSVTVGIGYRPEEYAMFGKSWDDRGKLMDECLEVLCRAWTGEPFDWNGRRVHVTPRGVTQPKPPILCGAKRKVGARRAARFGLPFQPAVTAQAVIDEYYAEAKRVGFESPYVAWPGSGEWIFCSRDPDRSWAELGRYLLHDAVTYASWQLPGQHSDVYTAARTVEELRAEGTYRILTPEQCLERVAERGPDVDFMHMPLCCGMPLEHAWESLELYTNEVLPKLRGRT